MPSITCTGLPSLTMSTTTMPKASNPSCALLVRRGSSVSLATARSAQYGWRCSDTRGGTWLRSHLLRSGLMKVAPGVDHRESDGERAVGVGVHGGVT